MVHILFQHVVFLYFLSCSLQLRYSSADDYEYNKVNFQQLETLAQLKSKFFTGDGNRANTNIVIGVADHNCKDKLESPAFRGMQRSAGGNVLVTVSLPINEFPIQIEDKIKNCAGLFWYKHNDFLTEPSSKIYDLSHESVTRWGKENTRGSVKLINHFQYPISNWWKDEAAKSDHLQGQIHPQKEFGLTTFIGHIFVARKIIDGKEPTVEDPIVDYMVVHESAYIFSPVNRIETCDSEELTAGQYNFHGTQLIKFTEGQIACDDMQQRLIEFTHRVWYIKRLGLNYVQPKLVPPVTHNGFELRRLPEDTYKWLKEWYVHAQTSSSAVEHAVGPCMNQHIAPSGAVLYQHYCIDITYYIITELTQRSSL